MTDEEQEVLQIFNDMLEHATLDGGRKRRSGLKPSWKVDQSHEAAIFSHLNKWKHREKVDAGSGQHPLIHLAWRALAIAWQETQETHGISEPIPVTPGRAAIYCSKLYCYQHGEYPDPNGNGYLCMGHAIDKGLVVIEPPPAISSDHDEIAQALDCAQRRDDDEIPF